MFTHFHSTTSLGDRRWTRNTALGRFSLLLALAVLSVSPAFGQMGNSATYSDIWIDGPAAPPGGVYDEANPPSSFYVVSCGVTQDSYNGYGHTYWVLSTLHSPTRSVSGTSTKTNALNAYTRVDKSLLYDPKDLGDFGVGSTHKMCCPYMGGNPVTEANCISNSITSDGGTIGASISCYVLQSFNPVTSIATLSPQSPCNTRCVSNTFFFRYEGSPPTQLLVITPYIRYGQVSVCSPVFRYLRVDSCQCGDIETNICAIIPSFPTCN